MFRREWKTKVEATLALAGRSSRVKSIDIELPDLRCCATPRLKSVVIAGKLALTGRTTVIRSDPISTAHRKVFAVTNARHHRNSAVIDGRDPNPGFRTDLK